MSVLLATDAQEFIFVDLIETKKEDFLQALHLFKSDDIDYIDKVENSFDTRPRYGGSLSMCTNGKHTMPYLAGKVIYDLRQLGVDLEKVSLSQTAGCLQIAFPWQYFGADTPRMRTLTFVQADITSPANYPSHLKTKLAERIDIFYMKAAFLDPLTILNFCPVLRTA